MLIVIKIQNFYVIINANCKCKCKENVKDVKTVNILSPNTVILKA